MNTANLASRALILLALLVLIVLGWNALPARAAAANHYAILAEAMTPADSSIQYNNYASAYLVTAANSTLNSATAYLAPLNLPDGAVISAVRVYGIDNDLTNNVGAALYRYNQDTVPVWGAKPVAVYSNASGSAGKFTLNLAVNADVAAVDNALYSYAIYLTLPRAASYSVDPPNLAVLRVVVDWGYTSFLPISQR